MARPGRGPALKWALIAVLLFLLLAVALEDSDGLTSHDFQDPTQFHHEHVILLLAGAIFTVLIYPADRKLRTHVHVTGLAIAVGLLLLSASLTNLPDNVRFFGGPGVQGKLATMSGTVLNLTKPYAAVSGVTVNWTAVSGPASGTLITDANGSYTALVPVGAYALRLNKSGYQYETYTQNVLPSRGSHVVIYLSTLRGTQPPAPIVNTNATNAPAAPPLPWYAPVGPTCLLYVSTMLQNGSQALLCSILMGPVSVTFALIGLVIILVAVAVRVGLDRRYR